MNADFIAEVDRAADRLAGYIKNTPLLHSEYLSELIGGSVHMKMENEQHSGSCKTRSTFNKLLALSPSEKERVIVTVSTGNNGIATSFVARELDMKGLVFLASATVSFKVDTIKNNGMEIVFVGDDMLEAELAARHYAIEQDATYFSPYNDWDVIYGQGTIAKEVLSQIDESVDVVIVPLGGGGLISGIGGYLKAINPDIEVIGVQATNSPVMYRSIEAGKIIDIDWSQSLADAIVGGLESHTITFDLCKQFVDDYILVSEEEIASMMRLMFELYGIRLEGAGVLSIAGLLQRKDAFRGKTVAVVCCGSNVSVDSPHFQQEGTGTE